jgi:pilus assembly protein CpaC
MNEGRPALLARRENVRIGRPTRFVGFMAAALATATGTWALPWPFCGAAKAQVVEDAPVRRVTVTLNKSKTLTFASPYSSAVIGSPDIADLLPMTNRTLYVQGKRVGTTNISVFDTEKRLVAVVDLEVTPDTASLRSKIQTTTGAQNISVTSANGQVILSGEASDAVSAARAVDLARGLAAGQGGLGGQPGGQGPVVDAMKVAASQQVMLRVRFLEVDRNAGRDLGINWFGGNKYGAGQTGLGAAQVTEPVSPAPGLNGSTPAVSATGVFPGTAAAAIPFGSLLAQVINTHGLRIDTVISALEDKGVVKTLAEPNLISQSGQRARFFAGAQIPIPTVQPGSVAGTTPTVTVQYYSCGVTLGFEPTVLNTGLINLHLTPEVCQVSSTTPVVVNGTTIPELTTRNADTDVELRDGQSFAIAGLLQAQDVNELSQLPWVGNVPVLGALFRSTNYQKSETDLVVIVTVHRVRPVAPGKHLVTPFDTTLPANDVDLFLMSDTERKKKYTEFVTSGGDLQGPYGHVLEAK